MLDLYRALMKLLINARKRNRMAAEVTAYGSASERAVNSCGFWPCITGVDLERDGGSGGGGGGAINSVSPEM